METTAEQRTEQERIRRATGPTTDELFKDLEGIVRTNEVICRIISNYEGQGETKEDYDDGNCVKLTDMYNYLTELAQGVFEQIAPRPSI